jgi:uncharacterized protein YbjT (DUF2867 family)
METAHTQIEQSQKTALVLGATGLIGQQLVLQLLAHPAYGTVRVLARRKLPLEHERLEQHLIDFEELEKAKAVFKVDDIFCALGTTRGKAGKEGFYRVDYTYSFQAAQLGAEQGANQFLLVSSVGADPESVFYYSQVKGELERDIQPLPYWATHIFRPSMLLGDRQESRPLEQIAARLFTGVDRLVGEQLGIYRPVEARTVAAAMIRSAQKLEPGVHTYASNQIIEIGQTLPDTTKQ